MTDVALAESFSSFDKYFLSDLSTSIFDNLTANILNDIFANCLNNLCADVCCDFLTKFIQKLFADHQGKSLSLDVRSNDIFLCLGSNFGQFEKFWFIERLDVGLEIFFPQLFLAEIRR